MRTPPTDMSHADPPPLPAVSDRTDFEERLASLRRREKAHARQGDAIAAARRRLPMVEVDARTSLVGPTGTITLLEAFEGRRQLIAYYFMWYQGRPAAEQCEGCTWCTSQISELSYLHSRDITFAVLCQGPGREHPLTATSWAGRCRGTRRRTRSKRSSWAGASG
jgi:predicted dithiol-disulfide oxidoreductase (DUF899 family)